MNWEPINLRHVPDEPPEPPDYLGLVYRGRRHWFSGPPESLKTLVAYVVLLVAVRTGENVALIDFEMGQRDARNRLREMGATDHDFDLLEFYEPDTAPTREILEGIADRCRLVVIDAAAGAYQLLGLDENRDAEKFNARMPDVLWKAGATTIVLDHVVKNPDQRGMWASGHHRKIGGTEVHLGFEAGKLSRGGSATTRITAHKDRPGFHARGKGAAGAVEFRSDPATHTLTWERKTTTANPTSADDWRPTGYMERGSRRLEAHGPMNRTAFYAPGIGKKEHLITALHYLVEDEYVDDDGSLLRSLKPYREKQSESPSPKPVPASPGPASDPGSLGSPAYKAGPGNGELEPAELDRLERLGDELGLT